MSASRNNNNKLSEVLYTSFAGHKDGYLSQAQFAQICFSLGSYLSPSEVAVAFALIDGDGNGQIGREGEDQQLKLHQVGQFFSVYDKDFSGALEAGEFVQMRKDLEASEYNAKSLGLDFKQLDRNGDGKISFNEFVFFMIDQGALDAADGSRPMHG